MSRKRIAKKNPASAANSPHAPNAVALETSPEFRWLIESPAEGILKLFPKAKANPKALAALAGLLAGAGADFGFTVPEWAKQASIYFWKATGMDFVLKLREGADLKPEQVGKLVGLWEMIKQEQTVGIFPHRYVQAMESICESIKVAINDDPPEVARDFHGGRVKAREFTDKTSKLKKRSRIFLFIACGWREVEKFKGQVELWRWLTKKNEVGESMLEEHDYSEPLRELRTICKKIGLSFRGRPKPD